MLDRVNKNKKLALMAIISLVIILIGVVIIYFATGGFERVDIDERLEASNALMLDGDSHLAVELWEDVIGRSSDSSNQFVAYLNMGLAYYDIGEYEEAIESFEMAENIDGIEPARDKRRTLYQYTASSYEKLGKNDRTAEYMRKTMELLDKESPLYEADREWYEDRIKELESE